MFTSSLFMSSSMARYLANERLPLEWPDMEAIRFGSFTCLYRLPTKTRLAMWLLAISLMGRCSSSCVFGSRTVTIRVMPALVRRMRIASLYMASDLWGTSVLVLYGLLSSLSRITLAFSLRGTRTVLPLRYLVLEGMYSTAPSTIFSAVRRIRSLYLQPMRHWNMNTFLNSANTGLSDRSMS